MTTEERELRRAVLATRRRRGLWIAVALGIGAHAAVVLMWRRPPALAPPPEIVVVPGPPVPAPPPAVIHVPQVTTIVTQAPAIDRFGDLGPCPEPVTHAPRGALGQPPERVEHVVAAARDAREVAAWSPEHAYASRDGGRTWERVLDAPGSIVDAAYDCHGRLMVYRTGGRLGVRAGEAERWIDLDGLDEPHDGADDPRRPDLHVLGGGPYPVVLGTSDEQTWDVRVAIARDGARWQYVDLGYGEIDALDGAVLADGTIRIVAPWVDCRDEGAQVWTIDPARGVERSEEIGWTGSDEHPASAAGVFAFEDADAANPIRVWRGGAWRSIAWTWAPDGEDDAWPELRAGSRPFAWAGDHVWTLSSRKARRVTARWPTDDPPHDVDAAGRAWGIDTYGGVIRAD